MSHCASAPNTCHPYAPVLPVHFAAASLTRVHLATRLCARPSASSPRCSAPSGRCRFPFLPSRLVPLALCASSVSLLRSGLGPSSRVASTAAACTTAATVSPWSCRSTLFCGWPMGCVLRHPRTPVLSPIPPLPICWSAPALSSSASNGASTSFLAWLSCRRSRFTSSSHARASSIHASSSPWCRACAVLACVMSSRARVALAIPVCACAASSPPVSFASSSSAPSASLPVPQAVSASADASSSAASAASSSLTSFAMLFGLCCLALLRRARALLIASSAAAIMPRSRAEMRWAALLGPWSPSVSSTAVCTCSSTCSSYHFQSASSRRASFCPFVRGVPCPSLVVVPSIQIGAHTAP